MKSFASLFGRSPTVQSYAPGRVNLIGEHTDYNGGYVLPTVIPQRTHLELSPRSDDRVSIWSGAVASAEVRTYALGEESPVRDWLDYVQGVTKILANDGYVLHGFEARIESSVPLGSGLSSSASLTVSLMRGLRSAFALKLDDVTMAKIGQRAENEFVGAHVGIMDPMAVSLADEGTALFLDARSLEYQRIPLPAGADLVVLHSGMVHRHAAGDYNTRRRECEQACALLGVRQLRDLDPGELPRVNRLPEPLNRRTRHVVSENERVLAAVAAMRVGDLVHLGDLFYASHASMRDDYQVSIPEIDLMVELAKADARIYGARLTGGGFGGSVVMLAHAGTGRQAAEDIALRYAERSGCTPKVLVPDTRPIPGPGSPASQAS
jgi:galactokinase